MTFRLSPSIRLAIRLRVQAANQRAAARKLCVEMMQHAAMGIDLRLVPGLAEIAAEQWVSSQELEEIARS